MSEPRRMSPRAVLVGVAAIVLAVLAVNTLIFSRGWGLASAPGSAPGATGPSVLPPGYVIGGVWVVLFSLFAAAWAILPPEARRGRQAIGALVLACLAYPFYALATDNAWLGLAGTVFTLVLAAVVVGRYLWPVKRAAALLVFPVIPWLLFAAWGVYADGLLI